ncbi:WD40 repeat domain-containing protein [Deinococcus budaensis]|uniref:WD40 repeat protein n=1 Tax=Deinococcus budaensis TaxID=1665626 RepID=A0A7W8GGF3_9DEIO|nr:WD40 repeat domain-containing protein [Deinococcus budaensis]MBB5235211.1 WD40 repeat protein [Deinococcus budaensis]
MLRLPCLLLALCSVASAQPRAEVHKNTPPGQATMRLYEGGRLLFQATTPGLNAVTETKFSPDGKWLLNLTDQGYVQLWDVGKGVRVKTFLAPFARVLNADFTPGSRSLLLPFRGEEGERPADAWAPSFWNLSPLRWAAPLQVARTYGPNGQYVWREGGYSGQVHFSADGRRMVTTSFRRFGGDPAVVWDARSGAHVATIPRLPYPRGAGQIGGAGTVTARLSPDGSRVLVLYVDGRLAEYGAGTARLLKLRGTPAEAPAQLEHFGKTGR